MRMRKKILLFLLPFFSVTVFSQVENQSNDVDTVYTSDNVRRLFSEGLLTLLDEETVNEEGESDYSVSALISLHLLPPLIAISTPN